MLRSAVQCADRGTAWAQGMRAFSFCVIVLYDSDAITTASSLQTYTFICTSMATFWTYDYVCSFHEEWTFLRHSHWTRMKVLYIVTRYMPFLFFVVHLYSNFIPNETPNSALAIRRCRIFDDIETGFVTAFSVCSECFFILRTYALWNQNKIILIVMLSTFTVVVAVGSTAVVFLGTTSTQFVSSPIPGITGCYQSSGSTRLLVPYILLFVFELLLICLTLTCAIRSWRSNPGRLYAVLVKHNIFYYAIGLLFSTVNILTSQLLHYAYMGMFDNFQLIIHVILATRMHLHLSQGNHWDRDQRHSIVFTSISLPNGPNLTSTNLSSSHEV